MHVDVAVVTEKAVAYLSCLFRGVAKCLKYGVPKMGSGWDPDPKSGIRAQSAGSTSKMFTSPAMGKRDPAEPAKS